MEVGDFPRRVLGSEVGEHSQASGLELEAGPSAWGPLAEVEWHLQALDCTIQRIIQIEGSNKEYAVIYEGRKQMHWQYYSDQHSDI